MNQNKRDDRKTATRVRVSLSLKGQQGRPLQTTWGNDTTPPERGGGDIWELTKDSFSTPRQTFSTRKNTLVSFIVSLVYTIYIHSNVHFVLWKWFFSTTTCGDKYESDNHCETDFVIFFRFKMGILYFHPIITALRFCAKIFLTLVLGKQILSDNLTLEAWKCKCIKRR